MGDFNPDWRVSPGEILREWREENGLSQGMVSKITGGIEHGGFALEDVRRIEAGEVELTDEDCRVLARTGISAVFWQNLERAYRRKPDA